MSIPTIPEVDAEYVVRSWLEQDTGTATCTETPAALAVPLLQAVRIGGGDDGVILDRATLSVHAFAASRDDARKLAYAARSSLYRMRGVVYLGAVVTKVAVIGGPAWTPYDDVNVRRFTQTVQVSIKTA